jgi:dTDP-4-amino-4,6-dideoxygalactose transaminase
MKSNLSRRGFLAGASAAGVALRASAADADKPALLGGAKVRTDPFPAWPVSGEPEERALMDVLHSGKWFRGNGQYVKKFEQEYARMTGAKDCLATCNGTAALFVSLNVMGVEPGDEVIIPPYTFIATLNVVLRQHALPVFVDTDPATFQMDARKLDAAITANTRAIMPVHLGGNVCDLDALLAISRRHKIPLIEDACQAHLSEWKGRKVGTFGDTGCFSFQASKNLNSGEGGAILFNDPDIRERAYAFHNSGSGLKFIGANFTYAGSGANLRLTEFQAGILLAQMERIEQQARRRSDNANYLTSMLREIQGIVPARQYEGCTLNAYHLYMLRYNPEAFAALPRAAFLKALTAEGIPCSGGYSPLNSQKFVTDSVNSRGYQRLFSAPRLKQWEEKNRCPANDRLCSEAVWFTQNMLLGERQDMEQIAAAVRKIQAHAGELVKA